MFKQHYFRSCHLLTKLVLTFDTSIKVKVTLTSWIVKNFIIYLVKLEYDITIDGVLWHLDSTCMWMWAYSALDGLQCDYST